jgi:succinyl-diaminopimelate desuccinylase
MHPPNRLRSEAAHAPELSREELGASLSALVRTPSVNPGMSELAMVEEIERQLEGTGCELTRVESMPGRPSLAAVLRGRADGPSLVLNGHMDTVAIDDADRWSVDPFAGEIRDGSVWGRGSVDMKGGLASQIAVARVLGRMRDELTGSLVLHFAAGEECGEPGTLSLLDAGFTGDWGITTEPTGLEIATAERGTGWFEIRIHGHSTHAATPQAGANPISAAEDVLAAVRRYNEEISTRLHPLLGHPICTVTMVAAGAQHNAVPDTCVLTIDRRLIPGETHESVRAELERVAADGIAAHDGIRAEVEAIHHRFEAAEVPGESPFIDVVAAAVGEVTGAPGRLTGTPYGSDVRNLVNDAKMEAITFGAGDVSLCHCADEHQELEALRQASLVMTLVSLELLA